MSVDVAAAREILVRAPSWLGDLVMTTPALRALRAAAPRARVTLWVRSGLEDLLAGSPLVDRCLASSAVRGGAARLRADARAARALADFDLGVCVPDSFSSALLMRGAGARPLVGYRRGGRGPLLDVAVPDPARATLGLQAREERVLSLLAAIGVRAKGTHLELATTDREEAAADALLARHAVALDGGAVGLAPGAGYGPAKSWPVERFARVGDRLAADGRPVVLLGSPAEAPLTRAVAAAMRAPAFDLAADLDVGVLKAIVRRLALLVCNDTGVRHVAVAFGVPCVVLFGPTSVAKTPRNLEGAAVVEREVACRPCYLRHCPTDHRCLASIDAEPVLAAARGLMERTAAARTPDAAVS